MEYLEFELPIKELEEQLDKCQLIGEESDVDVTQTCKQIEKKLLATLKKSIIENWLRREGIKSNESLKEWQNHHELNQIEWEEYLIRKWCWERWCLLKFKSLINKAKSYIKRGDISLTRNTFFIC